MDADGSDAFIIQKGVYVVRDGEISLVAGRDYISQGESVLLHGKANGDVAALSDYRYATRHGLTTMIVGTVLTSRDADNAFSASTKYRSWYFSNRLCFLM